MTTESVPAVETAAASDTTRPRARRAVLTIILSAVFMQLLDTTITMVAVPSIQASLKASYGEIQLVVALYMLAFACVLVTGGRLGDTYGRKKMFLLGMVGFTLASAVCGRRRLPRRDQDPPQARGQVTAEPRGHQPRGPGGQAGAGLRAGAGGQRAIEPRGSVLSQDPLPGPEPAQGEPASVVVNQDMHRVSPPLFRDL